MAKRYKVAVFHGEGATTYSAVDTWQPDAQQPAVIQSWSTRSEPHAKYLAEDFCERHNR